MTQVSGNTPSLATKKYHAAVDDIPESKLSKEQRKRARRLLDELDKVGRIDEATGQATVHEPAFRKLLKDRELFGDSFGDKFLAALSPEDKRSFFSSSEHGKRAAQWQEVISAAGAPGPSTSDGYTAWGLNASSTDQQIIDALKLHVPNLPPAAYDPVSFKARMEIEYGQSAPLAQAGEREAQLLGSAWINCVISRVTGTWPWILGLAIGAFFIGLAAGGPLTGAILAAAWVGANAVFIMLTCLFT